MFQQIVNAVVPVVVAGAVAVAVAVVKAVGSATVAYIGKKKEEVVKKIGANEYNRNLTFSEQAWGMVDEYFRITPNVKKTVDSTSTKFKEFLLAKVPGLTDAEIKDFQQTIAGEVNAGRKAITDPVGTQATPSAGMKNPASSSDTQEVVASEPTGAE